MRQAFVASTTLRPMAQQLLQDRTPAAYAGVEAFARAHSKEDAGALAWLVAGYAHVLDRELCQGHRSSEPSQAHAGDLGDYVAYYLGTSYLQTGHVAEALATLADFATRHPDSLLVRDAHVSLRGSAGARRPSQPMRQHYSKKTALPVRVRSRIRFRPAYAAVGDNAKAAEALTNVYYNMPASTEADAAYTELKKLPSSPPATICTQRKTRADLLMKAHRYNDAVDTYRELLNAVRAPRIVRRSQIALADALAPRRPRSRSQAGTDCAGWPRAAIRRSAAALHPGRNRMGLRNNNGAFYQTPLMNCGRLAPASSVAGAGFALGR